MSPRPTSITPGLGPVIPPVPYEAYSQVMAERDHWIRLFNRVEAAISHHKKVTDKWQLSTDADDALYAARDRILKAAAKGPQ